MRHSTGLLAPSSSDSEIVGRLVTHYLEFATAVLRCVRRDRLHAAFRAVVVAPQLLRRRGAGGDTRVQLLRDRLRGRWVGRVELAGAPNVWITEGGARPSKLKTLYPGEDPLAAQARCLQTSSGIC